jgi:hypothetical protein
MKKFPLIIYTPNCLLRIGINYEVDIRKVCKIPKIKWLLPIP